MIKELGKENSLFNQFMLELRDVKIQKDSMRFRRNLERIGEIFAYEISKELHYQPKEVETPLGKTTVNVTTDEIVLGVILRAALPLHQGLLNYFDNAENAFISSYRKYGKDNKFEIYFGYMSSPCIDGKVLILCDPMLATGASMALAYEALLEKGTPSHTHIVAPIASEVGVEHLKQNLPKENVTVWLGAVDSELTVKSYIVPGLGDAGDLAYGSKL